ncbi:hypothetical protein ACIHFE_12615 [Streptomyces sp. NPDC052396]|uniref:hypothetical protein n=1 Tax=Streptomyces sp. NPDC052396 TaxID=3365689 RepID=UPI0037CF742C
MNDERNIKPIVTPKDEHSGGTTGLVASSLPPQGDLGASNPITTQDEHSGSEPV